MKFSKRVIVMLVAGLILVGGAFLVVYPGGRRVAGDFRLVKAGDHIFKLYDTRKPENQLGAQGGVVRIGWDEHHIVVERLASPTAALARAQGVEISKLPWSNEAGWVVIDLEREIVSPTMTEAEVRQRQDVARIVTYRPDSAYERGHWW
jgi:hypothetical protein